MSDCTIVVLLSGRGSNLKSLIVNRQHFKITSVISDKKDAIGLQIAEESHIKTEAFPRSEYSSLILQKEAIYGAVRKANPTLVVLAGYMQIVAPHFVNEFRGRILNIHPSLLPLFGGLRTHERALQARHTVHGCTVHVLDDGVDTGFIIAQASVPVVAGDDADILAARVLTEEHKLYPWVINQIALRNIIVSEDGLKVTFTQKARDEAVERGFELPLVAPK